MRCWLLFHRELEPDAPEAYEVLRFQEVARKIGIDLQVLQPREFDLLVDSTNNWSTMYQDKKLDKPDLIIPRTGSETSYFTLAVLRHFERQGVLMVNRPAAIEAVADKLHTLQILAGAGLPVPKTILGKFPVDVDLVERELGFPVVVKTLKGHTRRRSLALLESRAVQRSRQSAGRCQARRGFHLSAVHRGESRPRRSSAGHRRQGGGRDGAPIRRRRIQGKHIARRGRFTL